MTLKLNGSSSGYTAINAPAAAGSNTLVLPADNGSANEVLKTDGSGNLDWVAQAAGGKILQIVQTTDASKTLSTSYEDIYDSDLSITLASTSNKILIIHNTHELKMQRTSAGGMECTFKFMRTTSGDTLDGSSVAQARCRDNNHPGGKLQHQITITYLDSGFSNLANTYNVQATINESSGQTSYCYCNVLMLIEVAA